MRRQCVPGPTFSTPAQSARKIGTGDEAKLSDAEVRILASAGDSTVQIAQIVAKLRCENNYFLHVYWCHSDSIPLN